MQELGLPKETLLEMYRRMALCRAMDGKMQELNSTGVFSGWLHLAMGQEAMPVGTSFHLKKGDYVKPDYRGAYFSTITMGLPLVDIFAPILGRRMAHRKHLSDSFGISFAPDLGLLGISGSLAEDVPIYAGAALSAKYRKTDQVTVCIFGDGTANKGPVHEAMNLAAVWKLPIVFICNNNQYALSTPYAQGVAVKDLAARAAGYGMPGEVVDGNDVIACYQAAGQAIARARKGEGPTFLESKTFRMRGHWEGDTQGYRPSGEAESWQKRDPLRSFEARLMEAGLLTDAQAQQWQREAKASLDRAIAEAQKLPPVEISEVTGLAID